LLAGAQDVVAQRDGALPRRALVVQHDPDALAEDELAAVDRRLAREHPQQRRLAGAVAPGDRQAVAALELERDATQQRLPRHVLGEIGCDDNGHGAIVGGGRGAGACLAASPRRGPFWRTVPRLAPCQPRSCWPASASRQQRLAREVECGVAAAWRYVSDGATRRSFAGSRGIHQFHLPNRETTAGTRRARMTVASSRMPAANPVASTFTSVPGLEASDMNARNRISAALVTRRPVR